MWWRSGCRTQQHDNAAMGRPRRRPVNKSELLRRRYFDTKRVGSYGGVEALRRVSRVPVKIVKKWLSKQDAYTLHKPIRTKFKRRSVVFWRTTPAVASRSRRRIEPEKRQPRNHVFAYRNRCVFQVGVVCCAEEQIGVVVGDGVYRFTI